MVQNKLIEDPFEPDYIFFGGTFDPPHQGHLDCFSNCKQRFPNAQVIVLPSPTPPPVDGKAKQTNCDFETRLTMCRLLFPQDSVSDFENRLNPPYFTLKTLTELKERFPGKKFGFLIGHDNLKNFAKWHEPKKILKETSLVVIRRDSPQRTYSGNLKNLITQVAEQLGEPFQWDQARQQAKFPGIFSSIYLIDKPISVASSTAIREFIGKTQPMPSMWLPEAVRQYIEQNQLYRG